MTLRELTEQRNACKDPVAAMLIVASSGLFPQPVIDAMMDSNLVDPPEPLYLLVDKKTGTMVPAIDGADDDVGMYLRSQPRADEEAARQSEMYDIDCVAKRVM